MQELFNMLKKKIQKKYKDLLHLAVILAILLCYAYYESNRKLNPQLSKPWFKTLIVFPRQP